MAWTFNDRFNSDTKNLGDLNGQDGWTGGAATDVVNDDFYNDAPEGNQSVYLLGNTSGLINIGADTTTSGTIYFAVKYTANGAVDNHFVLSLLDDPGSVAFQAGFRYQDWGVGEVRMAINTGSGGWVSPEGATASSDTWYAWAITFDTDADTLTYKWWKQGMEDWSAESGVKTFLEAAGTITQISLASPTNWAGYYDTITPTNPVFKAYTTSSVNSLTLVGSLARKLGSFKIVSNIIRLVDSGINVFYVRGIGAVETISLSEVRVIKSYFRMAIGNILTLVGTLSKFSLYFSKIESVSFLDIIRVPGTWWDKIEKHISSWTWQSKTRH